MTIRLVDFGPEHRSLNYPFLPAPEDDDNGGGSENDGDGDDSDDGDDDDSDDGDDDKGKGDDDKPVEKSAAEKRLARALKRARGESRKWKALAEKGTKEGESKDDGPDFRSVALQTSAVSALRDAGFTGNHRKALKVLSDANLDDIAPDSRGFFDPDDFEDVIEELREDWPELFEARGSSRRRGDTHDYDEDNRPRRPRGVSGRSAPPRQTSGGSKKKLSGDAAFADRLLKSAGMDTVARRVRSSGR